MMNKTKDNDDYTTAVPKIVTPNPAADPPTSLPPAPVPLCNPWTRLTEYIHQQVIQRYLIQALSRRAAKHPITTIVGIATLSLALVIVGFVTNFQLQVDLETLYAPLNSIASTHFRTISQDMNFPTTRPFFVLIHSNGDNVLTRNHMQHLFQALDVIQDTAGYDEMCHPNTGDSGCRILSATRYWHHNRTVFRQQVQTDQDLIAQLSETTFPGNTPADHDFILGKYRYNSDHKDDIGSTLSFVESFLLRIEFPETPDSEAFEARVLERLGQEKAAWAAEHQEYEHANDTSTAVVTMDYLTMYAYTMEFQRGIYMDLPLVLVVATIMSVFTMYMFYQPKDRLQSRSLFLGLGSVGTVGMALFSGYGLLFLCGVPFTTLTQVLPFIVFGIGLDDCFIITGAYFRTGTDKSPQERIQETMEEIGLSITVTTITTVLAFGIGATSTIPGIRWLCLYAAPSITFVYLYTITFFVALIVLDERRIRDNRRDCCIWIKIQDDGGNDNETNNSIGETDDEMSIEEKTTDSSNQNLDVDLPQDDTSTTKQMTPDAPDNDDSTARRSFAERFMAWYATFLMQPIVKACVLVAFTAYFAGCLYSTTQLTQDFKIEEFVPTGSYVPSFLSSMESYFSYTRTIGVYFRGIDQGNETVQHDMIQFVEDLASLPQVSEDIPLCWIRDFYQLKEANDERLAQLDAMGITDFNEQVDIVLSSPEAGEAYGSDIVRDADGTIEASRCWLFLDHTVSLNDVEEQIEALHALRETTEDQEVNLGLSSSSWSYFTYDELYLFWSFYDVAVDELMFTTVSGVVAVSLIALFLIPHWSAVLFVFPTIGLCYINLLGTLQYAGLHINAVTYVCLVIAIGLLVDFLMHVLLRYYEETGTTRDQKVQKALKTMGSSILVGGLTTFLGVVPLAFSTTKIFQTVCIAFLAMVILGLAHGLVFLPVVLSLVGPLANIRLGHGIVPDDHGPLSKTTGEEHSTDLSSTSSHPSTIDDVMPNTEVWI